MIHLPFFEIFKLGDDDDAKDVKDDSGNKPKHRVSAFSFGNKIADNSRNQGKNKPGNVAFEYHGRVLLMRICC